MRLFAKHKFTATKQRDFVGCPTATLLKHDVVTGATLMFRASIRRYCSPIPASWVHDGWLAWMIALHSRLGLIAEPLIDYRVHAGQQLGVIEEQDTAARTQAETRRQFYRRVARQFEDLLQRVLDEGWNEHDVLIGKIREKIAFLQRAIDPLAEPWGSHTADDRSSFRVTCTTREDSDRCAKIFCWAGRCHERAAPQVRASTRFNLRRFRLRQRHCGRH